MDAYKQLKGKYYHLVWSIMFFIFAPIAIFLVYEGAYWGS
jgi:hypothetical protein